MLLLAPLRPRRAQPPGWAGMNHTLYAETTRGFQDVQRALDIGAHVAARRHVGIRNGDQSGEVQYDVLPFHRALDKIAVLDIPGRDGELPQLVRGEQGEIAQA